MTSAIPTMASMVVYHASLSSITVCDLRNAKRQLSLESYFRCGVTIAPGPSTPKQSGGKHSGWRATGTKAAGAREDGAAQDRTV